MTRNNSRSAWSEVQEQISEWWEDLSENDPSLLEIGQGQMLEVPQNLPGHARSLAFMKVKVRPTSARPRGGGRKNRATADFRSSQYPSAIPEDWPEFNHSRGEKSRSAF